MSSLEQLEKEIDLLKKRNRRVEVDKAWEVSQTRQALVALFTYLSIGFYLNAIQVKNPWLNAIVPAVAFLLSTLTLPFLKKMWEKHLYKKL